MMIKQRCGRRKANKQCRRQLIVDAARLSFLTDGYAATSMSGLRKTLGGSKATLWAYFHSKEELFAAVVNEVTSVFGEELDNSLQGDKDIEAILAAFSEKFMIAITQPEAIATWRMVLGESGRFPELGRIFYEKGLMQIQRSLGGYFEIQIAAGKLRDDDPMRMARVFLGFCYPKQDEQIWNINHHEVESLSEIATLFARYFMRVFGVASSSSRSD